MNGWYKPAFIGDMFQGNHGAFNIQMNAAIADSITYPMLGRTPIFDFNNYSQYSTVTPNMSLLNPFYTLGQMSWQNMQNGGQPYFNAQGQFQLPFMMGASMNGNFWNNMGWTPSISSSSSSQTSTLSAEERDAKTKYETLLPLVKELSKYDQLTPIQRADLENATLGAGDTWKDKYAKLSAAYKAIDKDTRKEFLIDNGSKIGTTKDINGNTGDENSLEERLLDCGYEFEDDDRGVDNNVADIKESIETISDKNGTTEVALGLYETHDILDIISSWNTKYKNEDTDAEKRILDYVISKYETLKDEDTKKTALDKAVKPLTDALLDSARKMKSGLDKDSKAKLETAISELSKAMTSTTENNKIDNNLSTAFNNLYLIMRDASIKTLRNEMLRYYGDVDSEVINENMFVDETYNDLIDEGYTDDEIKNSGVAVKTRKVNSSAIDKKTAEEQVTEMIQKETVTELDVKHNDKTVYEETTLTGGRDYKRVFYIEDDKLVELSNTRFDDQTKKFVAVTTGEQKAQPIKASAIESDKEKVEQAQKKDADLKPLKSKAVADGKKIADDLFSWTTRGKILYSDTNDILEKVTADTVVELLEGFYSKSKWCDRQEGLIEFLEDEYGAKKHITMENKKKFINAMVQRAKAEGINDENIEEIETIMRWYEDDDKYKNRTTFQIGAWSRFWSGEGAKDDNEIIDKCIKNLYDKIKAGTTIETQA